MTEEKQLELTKDNNKYLTGYKVKYIIDTLDFFTQNSIKEEHKTMLLQALTRYKFHLIDTLAECKELHIRLYDNTDKRYKQKSDGFYKGLNIKNKTEN